MFTTRIYSFFFVNCEQQKHSSPNESQSTITSSSGVSRRAARNASMRSGSKSGSASASARCSGLRNWLTCARHHSPMCGLRWVFESFWMVMITVSGNSTLSLFIVVTVFTMSATRLRRSILFGTAPITSSR